MLKVMLFTDGTWLYSNIPKLASGFGKPEFHIDYGVLPKVLGQVVQDQMGISELDIVRSYLFGSYPENYDFRDDEVVQKRLDFFNTLKEEYHYELILYPINFRGRRIRRKDRDSEDDFEPKEKCVDVALATSLLYYAAIPHAYDLAIAIVGDRDYVPVLQHVRRLGKRIAIASIKNCCAAEYYDPLDGARVKDCDIIWLNDICNKIELKFEPQLLDCQSPYHKGERKTWTTYRPRRGKPFFCDKCRLEFSKQRESAAAQILPPSAPEAAAPAVEPEAATAPTSHEGVIYSIKRDRGYAFLKTEQGKSYYFHFTDLEGLEFNSLFEGQQVVFMIKREPNDERAGAARNVKQRMEEERKVAEEN